jgi:DNA-directed RNA polymerase specialized sigma24 family protein
MDEEKFRDLPSQKDFDALSEEIYLKVRDYIANESLAKQITSEIQIGLVKEDIQESEQAVWIRRQVESRTESTIQELWDYCFHYALKLTENPDLAQDTTQTVMVAFLQSKLEITYVKGWLKQAVYNQCMQIVKEDIKAQDLGKMLVNEPAPEAGSVEEDQLERNLQDADLKRLLSKSEYSELREMRKYKTIKDYAQAKGENPGAVRKRKHSILTNLKASYLNEQGWVNTPEILDYRTLVNVKRFMSTLVEKNQLGDHKQLFHYCPPEILPKVQETLQGVQMIFDWGITQVSPKSYQVSMVEISNPENPMMVVMEIAVNRANYIRITDCYGTSLVGLIPETKLDHYPSDKGKCLLTLTDVYKYIH